MTGKAKGRRQPCVESTFVQRLQVCCNRLLDVVLDAFKVNQAEILALVATLEFNLVVRQRLQEIVILKGTPIRPASANATCLSPRPLDDPTIRHEVS